MTKAEIHRRVLVYTHTQVAFTLMKEEWEEREEAWMEEKKDWGEKLEDLAQKSTEAWEDLVTGLDQLVEGCPGDAEPAVPEESNLSHPNTSP